MKLKKPLLALFAATALMAGCTPASPAAAQAKQEAQQSELQRQVQNYYGQDMQNSLTGYFNSHGMKASDAKEGLTIPWVASAATLKKLGVNSLFDAGDRSGYMVATGKTDAKGCPVFDVTVLKDNGKYTSRDDVQMPVCPKVAPAAQR
jgi:hypothetical protein